MAVSDDEANEVMAPPGEGASRAEAETIEAETDRPAPLEPRDGSDHGGMRTTGSGRDSSEGNAPGPEFGNPPSGSRRGGAAAKTGRKAAGSADNDAIIGALGAPASGDNDTPREAGPRVEFSRARAAEGLDQQIVRRVAEHHRDALRACYASRLKDRANLSGMLTVNLKIQKNGEIRLVTIAKSTLEDVPTEVCVRQEVRSWAFPERKGGKAVRALLEMEFSNRN